MSIEIVKHKSPDLPQCKMLCDTDLDAKLNNYELTKFFNKHSCNLIIGKPGSGKTSWLYSWFKSKKILCGVYHNVYLFQPSHSRGSMKDSIFDKLSPDKLYDELTYDNLQDVLDRIKEETELYDEEHDKMVPINHCIIFDDMTAYLRTDMRVRKLLKEIVFNRRHYHISIYFLVQTYLSVEPDIRKLFTNIVCFKCSKKEYQTIFDELIEHHKDKADMISKAIYDAPYKYMFYNTETGRMFKCFDELLFHESDKE